MFDELLQHELGKVLDSSVLPYVWSVWVSCIVPSVPSNETTNDGIRIDVLETVATALTATAIAATPAEAVGIVVETTPTTTMVPTTAPLAQAARSDFRHRPDSGDTGDRRAAAVCCMGTTQVAVAAVPH